MSRRTLIILVIVLIILAPVVLVLTGVIRRAPPTVAPVNLLWWTIDDTPQGVADVIAAYRVTHPYVRITVEQKSAATFDAEVKEAWAKDQGPDLVSLPSDAMRAYQDFLVPAPAQVRVSEVKLRRLFGRETTEISSVVAGGTTPRQVRTAFVDVVGNDVVLPVGTSEGVYGVPLAMDTLMLFANRDLLSSAGLLDPPSTWQELAAQVPKLTILDQEEKVVRPAISLGLASNVPHAADILTLLMLQNGTRMTDPTGEDITLHQGSDEGQNPGLGALTFYTSFAKADRETLTWGASQPLAHELFAQGKLAYTIGYQRDFVRIQQQAPGLNLFAANIPHLYDNRLDNDASAPAGDQLRTITYGRYWVQAVARKAGGASGQAWHFLQFASLTADPVRAYVAKTHQVAALKSIVREQQGNPDLQVPATQAAQARSWYRGLNATQMNAYLRSAIEDVATKGVSPGAALERAAQLIQLTLPQTDP